VGGDRVDFFVSHAAADRAWAEWVAWQLTDAGYTVELDVWDWARGRKLRQAISDALGRCDRVVALLSAAYFDRSRYTTEEWTAVGDVAGPLGGTEPGSGHENRLAQPGNRPGGAEHFDGCGDAAGQRRNLLPDFLGHEHCPTMSDNPRT
jgi:hypothetical protein